MSFRGFTDDESKLDSQRKRKILTLWLFNKFDKELIEVSTDERSSMEALKRKSSYASDCDEIKVFE